MELELGLTLTNYARIREPNLKELDLISYVNCGVKQDCDDNDDDDDDNCCLSSQSSVNNDDYDDGFAYVNGINKKKRVFDEAFEMEVESSVSSLSSETLLLPLLLWNKEPNEQDNAPKKHCNSSSFTINKNDENGIVGWPPIKSYRKKHCWQNEAETRQLRRRGGSFPAVENGGGCCGSSSKYVKVQMEGFVITRKINLRLYQCYESLICSLLTMFGKGEDSFDVYKLTYQDREGDWLLAGDVPWRTFIRSVQRLRILRRDAGS